MTHELKKIIETAVAARRQGHKAVLATVVALNGSSYRRPGVRMLLLENGKITGAVSGGCVEKEVQRQAASVFTTGVSKLMTYDGRYRLGCEGVLYILLERFNPGEAFLRAFADTIKSRRSFQVTSFYKKEEGAHPAMGTFIMFSGEKVFPVSEGRKAPEAEQTALQTFVQKMPSRFTLLILGAEHDAVQLCAFAAMTGWEVTVVTELSDPKPPEHFPGADKVCALSAGELHTLPIDGQTAVVIMSHNFAIDLKYLMALKDTRPCYLGLLGPAKRREKLWAQLMEHCPDLNPDFPETLHGPAGLNIGAETPQEIAIAIMAEILSVIRNQQPIALREKTTGIHTSS